MKYVSIIAMLMMATFASSCVELQYKTDATSRMTYRCLQGRWKFHSTLLRPKSVVPIKASISNKCQKNKGSKLTLTPLLYIQQNDFLD